jgi:hypothetical protein
LVPSGPPSTVWPCHWRWPRPLVPAVQMLPHRAHGLRWRPRGEDPLRVRCAQKGGMPDCSAQPRRQRSRRLDGTHGRCAQAGGDAERPGRPLRTETQTTGRAGQRRAERTAFRHRCRARAAVPCRGRARDRCLWHANTHRTGPRTRPRPSRHPEWIHGAGATLDRMTQACRHPVGTRSAALCHWERASRHIALHSLACEAKDLIVRPRPASQPRHNRGSRPGRRHAQTAP